MCVAGNSPSYRWSRRTRSPRSTGGRRVRCSSVCSAGCSSLPTRAPKAPCRSATSSWSHSTSHSSSSRSLTCTHAVARTQDQRRGAHMAGRVFEPSRGQRLQLPHAHAGTDPPQLPLAPLVCDPPAPPRASPAPPASSWPPQLDLCALPPPLPTHQSDPMRSHRTIPSEGSHYILPPSSEWRRRSPTWRRWRSCCTRPSRCTTSPTPPT
jgi:hypothetical protein